MEALPQRQEQNNTLKNFAEKLGESEISVIKSLNATNDKDAKAEFLENPDLSHPNNEYGNLDPEQIRANILNISEVITEVQASGLPNKQQTLISILAEDYNKKNEFLAANIAYNEATTPEEKAEAAIWHRQANEALYGSPDENTFYCLLSEKLSQINPQTPEEQQKLALLKEKIGPIPESTSQRFKPKPETVKNFSETIKYFFAGFLEHIPEDQESFTSDEVVGIINEILQTEFGGMDVQYHAVATEDASNASVNHQERIIKFPVDKTYSKNKAAALIVHELGTHVLRAIPYLESDTEAFSIGFPGSEVFDEGIAKCIEQAIEGEYKDSGIDHYINIGLATFKNKNFREVFDIQNLLKELFGEKNSGVLNAVQRCFRGTGELPNNKDLAYYNGANQVWQYIEEHIDDPYLMDNLFLSGKTNVQDPTQSWLTYEAKVGGL